MGCTSSTEVITDPVTGQEKTKKKLGGAYPGQRRPVHNAYVPPEKDFGPDGKATVHFIAYGGGNALTLVKQDGSSQPQSGGPVDPSSSAAGGAKPQFIKVTLPDGVVEGQTIHVQAPDGRLNAIVIPPGFGPGDSFTVEFAPEEQKPPSYAPAAASAGTATSPSNDYKYDDGFATGFQNQYYGPTTTTTATAVSPNEPEIKVDGYSAGGTAEPEVVVVNATAYPMAPATPVDTTTGYNTKY